MNIMSLSVVQVCSAYALELARDGVRQGSVLLKNTGKWTVNLDIYNLTLYGPSRQHPAPCCHLSQRRSDRAKLRPERHDDVLRRHTVSVLLAL